MKLDASDARKTTASAISTGAPILGMSVWRSIMSMSEGDIIFSACGVRIKPGRMALHRMPRLPNWPRHYASEYSRSEEHTSELQSLMRISYAVFCLKQKKKNDDTSDTDTKPTKYTDTQGQHTKLN